MVLQRKFAYHEIADDFRFRRESGRAAAISQWMKLTLKQSSGAFTRFAYGP
jgi:hypothetical protein